MARYRTLDVKVWGDKKFLSLSPMLPSGQTLWIYLLQGPHTSIIPGLFVAGKSALCDALNWSTNDFDRCFAEIEALGMATADWRHRVIWLPRAFAYNQPKNPNVVRAIRKEFDTLPECDLVAHAKSCITANLAELGPGYLDAFKSTNFQSNNPSGTGKKTEALDPNGTANGLPNGLPDQLSDKARDRVDNSTAQETVSQIVSPTVWGISKPVSKSHPEDKANGLPNGLAIQYQHQEQHQHQEQDLKTLARSSAIAASALLDLHSGEKSLNEEGGNNDLVPTEENPNFELLPLAPDPVVVSIPLIGGAVHDVLESHVAELQQTFPAVNVRQQLREIRQHNRDNPRKRKTRSGIQRHITGWLSRHQDKAANHSTTFTQTESGDVALNTTEAFDKFWAAYPAHRQTGRSEAFVAWSAISPSPDTDAAVATAIMDGLQAWNRSAEWLKDSGQYVPRPVNWLKDRRWVASPVASRHFGLDDKSRFSGTKQFAGMTVGEIMKQTAAQQK